MRYSLRLTEAQRNEIKVHLFPGDGLEAVALLLCGRRKGEDTHIFTVRKIIRIPYEACSRKADSVTWPTSYVEECMDMDEVSKNGCAIIKIHSHNNGFKQFSKMDDKSDVELYGFITSILDNGQQHGSVFMLENGAFYGRVIGAGGEILNALSPIIVVGNDIEIYTEKASTNIANFDLRQMQAFGKGTIEILKKLSIAVIGCSGTGSVVVEQLARLGVGRLVLIDPDVVEDKNLNRILNTGKEDSYLMRPKVNVLATAIARMGFGQEVIPLQMKVNTKEAVMRIAECDIVFGCMDTANGRHLLNRIATFYTIPYFDVGVKLEADGKGGIDLISGAVHYLQPGLSSLFTREVYNMKRVESEDLRDENPDMYRSQIEEGYIKGVDEDRPAVISINMLFASLVVNDFLARIHPYRNFSNNKFVCINCNLSEMEFFNEPEGTSDENLNKHIGKGDVAPLLERPSLS